MTNFRLLITDITEYGELRCVAGWDLDRNKMIRPEPHPAAFWPAAETAETRHLLQIGNIVRLSASRPNPATQLPHYNQDRVVSGDIQLERRLNDNEFRQALNRIQTQTIAQAFANPVELVNNKAYIRTGTNHWSLQGLRITSNSVVFFEENYGGKRRPRCHINTDASMINLSIAAADLRANFRAGGITAIENKFINANNLHVRLGLARAWDRFPDRCYMQVNGIYAL